MEKQNYTLPRYMHQESALSRIISLKHFLFFTTTYNPIQTKMVMNVVYCFKNNQRLSRACIVHLVIKKNNWSYVKTMSCSGSHLGITINIKNTKFVKDLPMIDAQFRFNQCNSFREEYISVFSPYGSVLIL